MDSNRDSFLLPDEAIGDVDLLSNCIFRDEWADTGMKFVVKSSDVGRPDLMSSRILGTQDLWWILLKYNDIDDPWNELWPGQILRIPDSDSIKSYLAQHKVR